MVIDISGPDDAGRTEWQLIQVIVWIQFAICTAFIFLSGTHLSRYGDVIAEKTELGRTWIGVALLASVTSLPELVTGVSSVTVYNLPNIAVGDVLGSCLFNLLILAVLDLGTRRPPLSSLVSRGHLLTAGFGILLLGVAAICILEPGLIPSAGWVSTGSLVVIGLYLLAMRTTFKRERQACAEEKAEAVYGHISKRIAYRRFAFFSLMIIAGGVYLPHLADEIASITGMGGTFVGSIFVAFSTSLPEIVVTRAALRMGSVDIATGNILGSNLFDVAILGIDDIAYSRGPLYQHIAATHALTAVAAITMTAVWMLALISPPRKKMLFLSSESLGLICIYTATFLLLFFTRDAGGR